MTISPNPALRQLLLLADISAAAAVVEHMKMCIKWHEWYGALADSLRHSLK